MKRLVIWGSGGHGREVLELVADLNQRRPTWEVCGWLDDQAARHGLEVAGLRVLGGVDWWQPGFDGEVIVAVGDSQARARIVERLAMLTSLRYATLVHPSARLGRGVEVGEGAMIFAGVLTTVDARIGAHAIVNLGVSISHDCSVGDFATLGPGVRLAGAAQVGRGCNLGMQSSVLPGCEVGDFSIVGAGATVTRSLPSGVVAYGTPARVVRRLDSLEPR